MTSYTPDQAYAAIKALESAGNLQIHPLGTQTVVVGSYNGATNRFAWTVPTIVVTSADNDQIPGTPHQKPIISKRTVGEVVYTADTLMLSVTLSNLHAPVTFGIEDGASVTAAVGQSSITIGVGGFVSAPDSTGALTTMELVLTSVGREQPIPVQVFSLPSLGAGVLTLPAVPVGLVYAPPPGSQNKNYAQYADIITVGQKIQSTVVSTSSSKTATAYTNGDFITKINGIISSINSMVPIGTAKTVLSSVSLALNALTGILGDTSGSSTNSMSTTTDHALQTTASWLTTYSTPPGAGPGAGDRIIYLRNVRIAWAIWAGQLSFHVLDDDGVRDFTMRQLSSDAAAMAASGGPAAGPVSNLDAATVASLLRLDPFVGNSAPTLSAPRFVPNDPASVGGGDTGTAGDIVSATHEITTTDTSTHNTITTQITDYKPGWLVALFGSDQATENQLTMTNTAAIQLTNDTKQTVTVYFFAGPTDPPYLSGLYYDTLFSSLAFVPWAKGESVPPVGRPPVTQPPTTQPPTTQPPTTPPPTHKPPVTQPPITPPPGHQPPVTA